MGCTSSKLDDLPAVSLCRDRCTFLDEAMKQRYALSQSHIAYIHSLKSVGHSLHSFLSNDVVIVNSPRLDIPAPKKDGRVEAGSGSGSASASGSHIQFHSDLDDDDDDDEHDDDDEISDFDHDHDSEIRYVGPGSAPNREDLNQFSSYNNFGIGSGGRYMHMNYMKSSKTKPTVVYEQRPMSPETYRVGEGSGSSSLYNPYQNSNQSSYFGYSNHGYYGNSSGVGPVVQPAETSKPPPPPPSPPRASAWDFLNFFDGGNDRYYPAYTPSRDSKELREEEGIPDLEDENEVVKEVHGDQKFVGGRNLNSKAPVEEVRKGEEGESSGYRGGRASSSVESDGDEYEVHVVEKKVVDEEGRGRDRSKGMRDVSDVAKEIEVQFQRASESGNDIAKMLEVGRVPYNRNHASRMLHVMSPSLSVVSSQPSTSTSADSASSTGTSGPAFLEIEQDLALRAKNLSSTMQKLYLWEKKLYNEVKAEEKMRVVHDRKRQKLKRLDEKGAEAQKVDSTRALVRSLSTKMRIAIQVVDKISATINEMRDDELWPQLNALIKGLSKMYRCMLECHHAQCQAIKEAGNFSTLGSGKKLRDDHLEATLQLEHELINWTLRFSTWISAQKGYARALNNWLLKCLLYEPEETPDGVAPFSPGRIGAPPIFVICNQWSEAINGISEKEVLDSMRHFANGVLQMWEQDKLEMRQRSMADKDYEKKVKFLDREDQKIQKQIQALDKKMVVTSGDGHSLSVPVYQSDASVTNVQASLLRIFDAMERFTAESTKAYDDLIQRSEEETLRSRE